MALQHLRSSTANKRPTPAAMSDGQLAMNTNLASPGLFLKDSNGDLVKVGPVHVGTTAPNATPASGGQAGNSVGEQWLDTSSSRYVFKIWDGTAWRTEDGEFVNSSGDTMTGALVMDNQQQVRFRETTANGTNFIAIQAPASVAADRTLTLPDVTGTIVSTGDTGTVTSTMILDGTILNADVNASAAIAGTKISPDFGSQTIATTGVFSHALGAAATPSITFTGDLNTGVYSPGADQVAVATNGTARLYIASDGKVGVGTTSPAYNTHIKQSAALSYSLGLESSANDSRLVVGNVSSTWRVAASYDTNGSFQPITVFTSDLERIRITEAGRVGIGTTSPQGVFQVGTDFGGRRGGSFTDIVIADTTSGVARYFEFQSASNASRGILFSDATTGNYGAVIYDHSVDALSFQSAGSERARIDSSGRLLVGTSSTSQTATAVFQGNSAASTSAGLIKLARGISNPSDGFSLGDLEFCDSGHVASAFIGARRDGGTWTSGSSQPSRLVFSTTADGASSPTERMRITSTGTIDIGQNGGSLTAGGAYISAGGQAYFGQAATDVLVLNRRTNDGDIVSFRQDGGQEGTISVSGTTVSYNGAHLSRWSQLPGGAERIEILRGSVLSNLDEMCEWGEEDNEQLNRMKVSDVEGDKNVSGVFQCWDDDDDTYTNDFYCAMTGDFIIRIAEGVTVERGDLLMSAGDGTAKPQDDDIIRSKTIAKVTSTNVSCTYEDGSYCVPCVLMAC